MMAMAQPAQAQRAGDKIAGRYICVFNKNMVSRSNTRPKPGARFRPTAAQVKHVYTVALRGFAANMSPQPSSGCKATNPSIDYCEQDQVFTTVQLKISAPAKPGGGVQPAQETPWGIARVSGGGAGSFATAWVIDTGIDFTHPDLNVDPLAAGTSLARHFDAGRPEWSRHSRRRHHCALMTTRSA